MQSNRWRVGRTGSTFTPVPHPQTECFAWLCVSLSGISCFPSLELEVTPIVVGGPRLVLLPYVFYALSKGLLFALPKFEVMSAQTVVNHSQFGLRIPILGSGNMCQVFVHELCHFFLLHVVGSPFATLHASEKDCENEFVPLESLQSNFVLLPRLENETLNINVDAQIGRRTRPQSSQR